MQLRAWGADFIAVPGHKGLLGPQGTGMLLCGREPNPLLFGGTGSNSMDQAMPDFLPDRLEAGTLNVPGIAGLDADMCYVHQKGIQQILQREHAQLQVCAYGLEKMGYSVFTGPHQAATVSFLPKGDCQELADRLGQKGIAVRAGLHCAPLAHTSAGTLETGTVRVSFGHDATSEKTWKFLRIMSLLS